MKETINEIAGARRALGFLLAATLAFTAGEKGEGGRRYEVRGRRDEGEGR